MKEKIVLKTSTMDQVRNEILKIEEMKSQGDYKQAISYIQSLISKNANEYRFYEELADIYLYLGNLKKAENAVDFSLGIQPDSATGNYLKGFVFLSNSMLEDAILHLEKSNQIVPNNAEVLRNLGWSYTLQGSHAKGIAILRRASALSPNDPLIGEDLAMALIADGKIEEGNMLLVKIGRNDLVKNKK